ncbi:hypothetical protein M407DRAFT_76345 [Tulasnella calospora MUT 4182]|uniref:Plus3 domain-containing protein n=1 Tax=Tulasnella calospora MUT 4182 TaxID=1051891 RepID=A0A0C3LU73_9AGAM|nr:hypothetical protein M407DRAFT_76345 [Tulasnella calospora MUT 4182]
MMFDEALSDEILALAGENDAPVKHSRKRQGSSSKGPSSKRRKHEMTDDSEPDAESDEEQEELEYPLEGKFKDEADREYLLGLPEIKREEILSKRAEDMQKETERRNLERMVKSQTGPGGSTEDAVAKAAKRKHTGIGASEKKSRGLEALKQKRQLKESRRANKTRDSESPTPRRRSSSPSSDSEDEEGQVHRRGDDASDLDGVQIKGDEKITLDDLSKARLTRDMLESQCMSDRFDEYVKGAWVRLLVGNDQQGQPVYRLCEVVELQRDTVDPYPLGNKMVNQLIELRHGAQTRAWPMMKISCGAFSQKEFERVMTQMEVDKIKAPSRSKLDKKGEVIRNINSKLLTDAEISAMIARQKELKKKITAGELYSKKAGLNTQRMLASKRGERDEVAKIDAQLAALESSWKPDTPGSSGPEDVLAKINERNRRANLESMRKADLELAKRKRDAAAGGAVPDLSARVKTIVKTRYDSRCVSCACCEHPPFCPCAFLWGGFASSGPGLQALLRSQPRPH